MAYISTTTKEQRTPSVKKAERQRDRKRRQRKRTAGRPGRKSQETRQLQADAIRDIRQRNVQFLTEADLPKLTGQQRDIANILIQPGADILTNIQIARLAGVTRDTVGSFRGSYSYYEALAESDVFEKRLVRLEAMVLRGIEKNITEHCDNTSMKFVLNMRGRVDEAHRNMFQISADTVQIGIGQSLKNLPEAKYEVIEEDKGENSD